jgi:hypothetical protein
VDIELILDSTEIMAPALKGTTRRILAATSSSSMGVSLELADVLARRTAGWPEVHITAAADELLTHLVAIEVNVLGEESVLMTLARIGAQAMMSRAELEDVTGPGESLIGKRQCWRQNRARIRGPIPWPAGEPAGWTASSA